VAFECTGIENLDKENIGYNKFFGGGYMKRRYGRELALQALFKIDVGKADPKRCIEDIKSEDSSQVSEDIKEFAISLTQGVVDNLEEIDRAIESSAHEWSLDRMASVDRNVLRIAAYEIMFCPDIPIKVSINEALELVKIYSEPESVKFVNGVLGTVAKKEERI
jgi:N utilization substance protein B